MDNFFYNLNDKLNAIRDLPSTTHGQLNERDMSRAAKGYKKYDNTEVDEGLGDVARMVGGAVTTAAGKALNTLGHGSDKDLRRKMQRDMGATGAQVHGKKSMAIPNPKQVKEANAPINFDKVLDAIAALYGDDMWENDAMQDLANDLEQAGPTDRELDFIIAKGKLPTRLKGIRFTNTDDVQFGHLDEKSGDPMTAKQKSFAALAEPPNKITFADKIAGAKKEVDEMLGDVAAEAMKSALASGRGRSAEMDEASQDNAFTAHKRPRVETPPKGSVEHGRKHDIKHDTTDPRYSGRIVTRRVDPSGISVGADDEAAQSGEKRSPGRPKGPDKAPERVTGGATKHKGGRKMTKEGAGPDDIAVLERLMDEAFAEGNNALGNAIQGVLEKMDSGEKQVDEKAVSKKQQRFMGMVHAAQKGEKPASGAVAKTAKSMGKKDAEDFAATEHKGLPEKKKPEGKKKEVGETTSSGSVSTGGSSGAKGGVYGKGIYDSFNRDVEAMIAEGMTINMSMNSDGQTGPAKSLTVTATDEDAEQLAQMLSNAGMGAAHAGQPEMHNSDDSCGSCGMSKCGCGDIEEALDENNPDWPTEPTGQEDNINYYDTDGLNGRKSTGQTTVSVIASQGDRQMAYEDEELARMMEMAGMSTPGGEQGVAEGSGDPEITPGMKTQYGTVVSVNGNDVVVKASNGDETVVNIRDIDQAVAEGYYDLDDEGMQPIDLSTNPPFKQLVNRYTQLFYQGHEGSYDEEESAESDAIEQYVAKRFGQKGSDHLLKAAQANYGGRDDGRGMGGSRGSNLGQPSQPSGDFRTTKAGVMNKQDAKTMKNRIADRLGRHPEPNLPEQSYAESEQAAIKRMMEMAGIAEAKGEKPDFLDVDGDKNKDESFKDAVDDKKAAGNKKVRESMSTVDTMEQNLMRQFSNFKI